MTGDSFRCNLWARSSQNLAISSSIWIICVIALSSEGEFDILRKIMVMGWVCCLLYSRRTNNKSLENYFGNINKTTSCWASSFTHILACRFWSTKFDMVWRFAEARSVWLWRKFFSFLLTGGKICFGRSN